MRYEYKKRYKIKQGYFKGKDLIIVKRSLSFLSYRYMVHILDKKKVIQKYHITMKTLQELI